MHINAVERRAVWWGEIGFKICKLRVWVEAIEPNQMAQNRMRKAIRLQIDVCACTFA